MKAEPKVGQVWKHEMWDNHYKIVAICGNWIWAEVDGGKPTTFHLCYLKTMIRDEHGNKPTEDNDDVEFYDVVKRDDGDYWVENKHGKSWIARTVSSTFGRADDEGRTCVGFLYHSEKRGYSFNDKAIDSCLIYFAPKAGSLEFIKDHIERERFSVPVKAVFKRLEAK